MQSGVWNMILKLKIGTKTNISIIKIVAKETKITVPLLCAAEQACQHLGAAIEVYQKKKEGQGNYGTFKKHKNLTIHKCMGTQIR